MALSALRPLFHRLRRLTRRPLLRDARGVSAVEFGMTAPILFLVVFGSLQMAQSYYCYVVLNGAVNAAARKSSLQSGQTGSASLDTLVSQMIKYVMPTANVTFTRKNYSDFTSVGMPEDFTDTNKNGKYDSTECFVDMNGNGVWDRRRERRRRLHRHRQLCAVLRLCQDVWSACKPDHAQHNHSEEPAFRHAIIPHGNFGMSMTSTQAPAGASTRPARRPFLSRLLRNTSAASIVELGLAMPLLMGLALTGVEVVALAITHVKLNQLAITVADNASRAKQTQVNGAPQFREYDVNQVFRAAALQAEDLDIPNRGRVILSSLQVNGSGGQTIAWQRCWGKNTWPSRYGPQGTGATGTAFKGMGYTSTKMTADAGTAIMFVEIAYNYKPFFLGSVIPSKVIRKEAALYVRDDRDLTQIYNPSPTQPVASC